MKNLQYFILAFLLVGCSDGDVCKQQVASYGSIVVALIALYSLMAIVKYRQKLKEKDMELDEKISESESLIEEIQTIRSRLSQEIDEREETVRKLFREQFSSIDSILSEYYSKRDVPRMRARIADDLDRAISTIGSADKLSELEDIINRYNDDVIAKLREQISPVDDRSVSILTLSAAGFSLRSISLITGNTIGNINNLWYRLKKRVADSSAPDRDLILTLFRR